MKLLKNSFLKLTNGNEAILNGQIDLNIPGGAKSILPLACTTKFVFIVPSKLSSALLETKNNIFFFILIHKFYLLYRRISGVQTRVLGI
jgi:hypothetical protein